jgi:hypothetical protein
LGGPDSQSGGQCCRFGRRGRRADAAVAPGPDGRRGRGVVGQPSTVAARPDRGPDRRRRDRRGAVGGHHRRPNPYPLAGETVGRPDDASAQRQRTQRPGASMGPSRTDPGRVGRPPGAFATCPRGAGPDGSGTTSRPTSRGRAGGQHRPGRCRHRQPRHGLNRGGGDVSSSTAHCPRGVRGDPRSDSPSRTWHCRCGLRL